MTTRNLAFCLLLLILPTTVSAKPNGSSLIAEQKCDACHRFSSEEPVEGKHGPDLFYSGDKFKKPWLEDYLQNPGVIRKAGYFRNPDFLSGKPSEPKPHPKLAPQKAKKVAEFLMSLKTAGLELGKIDNVPLSKGKRVKAKILFERNHSCIACHEGVNLAGKPRGGISGPSLFDAGNRLNPDWVYNWLKSPKKFQAKGRMPVYQLDENEMVMLTKYLMTLKKENLK